MIKKWLLFLLIFTCVFSLKSQDKAMEKGDLIVSAGAGKNRFFEESFDLFAPMTFPVNAHYAFSDKFEVGIIYTPITFSDRSNIVFRESDVEERDNTSNRGGIQSFGVSSKISFYNEYGLLGFFDLGGTYALLQKRQVFEGFFQEKEATGYQAFVGFGGRYFLGNEYGDIFPWFFEISLRYTQHNYQIDDFRISGETQPQTDRNWQDLNFGSIDVFIKFGYKFKSK